MSCKNKGPCICGKKEQYLFTPHLTEEERWDLIGVRLIEKESDIEGNNQNRLKVKKVKSEHDYPDK